MPFLGSLTTRQDLIDGSVEIQAGSSKRYSVRASCPVTESDTEKSYRPSIEVSYSSSQPLKIDGSLSVSKGRKQQYAFDLKANKPSKKPLSLKGISYFVSIQVHIDLTRKMFNCSIRSYNIINFFNVFFKQFSF